MIPNVIAAKIPHRGLFAAIEVVGGLPVVHDLHSAGSELSQARAIKHLLVTSSLLTQNEV